MHNLLTCCSTAVWSKWLSALAENSGLASLVRCSLSADLDHAWSVTRAKMVPTWQCL